MALYRYVLVFIVPHVDIELEDNKQFISNIPRISSLDMLWNTQLCQFMLFYVRQKNNVAIAHVPLQKNNVAVAHVPFMPL